MNKKIYAVFVAGGSGTRMGGETPKQFLDLCGRPVLQQTIIRFVDAVPSINVVVVLPRNHFDTWKQLCKDHPLDCPQVLVEGGLTRFHSVQNALAKIPDDAIVMIHDGVRPLVSAALIERMSRMAQEVPALIPVVPVTDTLKTRDGSPAPDRANLFAAQTPQVFHADVLKHAYLHGYSLSFTDDASVASADGVPLTYIDGEKYNIKLTTPDDLRLAKVIFGGF